MKYINTKYTTIVDTIYKNLLVFLIISMMIKNKLSVIDIFFIFTLLIKYYPLFLFMYCGMKYFNNVSHNTKVEKYCSIDNKILINVRKLSSLLLKFSEFKQKKSECISKDF